MKLANVSPSQLEYLVAAIEHATWKDAARHTGVTPSAFSQGIAQLERRLGVDLFDREGRRRVPTAEAHVAATHSKRILAELHELERWATEVREGAAGHLDIGMIDTAAVHHFGDTLMAYRAANPRVSVRLTVGPSGQLHELLMTGDVDLIVSVAAGESSDITSEPLVSEPLYVYAPPGADIGRAAEWGPWVSFPADSRTRTIVGAALRGRGVDFEVVAESSQPAVIREMVRLGMGWTVLSAVDAEREPHALVRAHPKAVAERVLVMSRRADRMPSPALATLIGMLSTARR